MARVHLRCTGQSTPNPREEDLIPARLLVASAAADPRRRHHLVDDPAAADIILFAEAHDDDASCGPFLGKILADPVYRRFPGKCFVHSGQDRPVPLLPGIYPSVERRWAWAGWARSGCYLVSPNPYLAAGLKAAAPEKRHLASFLGTCGRVPVRHRLLLLKTEPDLVIRDTGPGFIAAIRSGDDDALAALKSGFVQTSLASRFLICPRGVGAGSIRLFEAMELGVAPVIVSDAWTPPAGPPWPEFSIRVPERDLPRLPAILRDRAPDAAAMGAAARRAWEAHYAPTTLFDTVAEDCAALARERQVPAPLARAAARAHLLRPVHARRLIRRLRGR